MFVAEHVVFYANYEAVVYPLAGFEVEFPFWRVVCPALWWKDVFEEARACETGAGYAVWGEGVVRGWSEEVGLPFFGCGGCWGAGLVERGGC